ncbi:MAG: hypothetical protein J1G02_02385, partial [Clostridiales bacterium]|nr:hypothetical protein [Clostridiales bacterium]
MFKSFQARKTTLILCLGLTLLLAVLGLTINPKADTHKVYAWGESVTCTSVKEEYLQWDYLNLYQIKPNTHFSYSSNSDGYNGYALARAFDGNFDTAFVGTKTINYNSTVQINAVFKKTTTVDRIIYKCASFDGKPSGFPTYLRLSWGSNYGESTFLQIYNVTTDIVMFIFNQPITTDRLRFEFADVCVNNNSVSGTFSVATAAELMFLQPENQYAAKAGDLFTDYRWTELKSEYKNIDMLHDMKTQLSGYINYDTEFGPRIERALALMEGTLQYDPAREFTTDGAGINKIQQYGDIGRYARNTLLMQYMGINRQVTGIYQNANKTINIWVDAPEGVPLPWIETVQYKEHYWSLKDTFTLHRGRNVITMSDFVGKDRDLYKNFTVSGGSIYIINPYTPDEQPGGVKIYIEGGYRYPVMTYETGVEQYRAELDAYVKLVNDNPNDYADITELVANHAILTFPAGKANGYYQSKHNPRGVMESWDAMIEEMFAFDGIALNEGEEHYDDKNKHLYINVRTV